MFNRKREISSIEKTEIILENLYDELAALCAITDISIQDIVSIRIKYVQEQISFQSKKLKYMTQGPKK